MRSGFSAGFVVFLSCCCFSCLSADEPMAAWSPREREGFQHLLVARRFSFGGVGIAGLTSTGESAFQAVLEGRNAAEIFKVILSPGTNVTEEGKLYALCGI